VSEIPSTGDSESSSVDSVIALTVDQVCSRLQLSRPSVIGLIRSKRLHAIKVGRSWRISQQSLDRLLAPPQDGAQ
jgi:excisionase family DNA binding protein